MNDTLKTIAEYMGLKWCAEDPEKCDDLGIDCAGRHCAIDFKYDTSRDDLQLVIEKFTPAQHDLYYSKRYSEAWRVLLMSKGNASQLSSCIDRIPTQTLADICAAVIGETK